MFECTFLGHHGWLFSAGASCVLVDPLLTEEIGLCGAVGRVFPPRHIDLSRVPPISAVVLTHEGEDHFDIPSLNRLDRQIPLYLAARSSAAAFVILREMGFLVRPFEPGHALRLGELELSSFRGSVAAQDESDESDALAFVVRDRAGHGSFVAGNPLIAGADLRAVRATLERPGLWCYANRSRNLDFLVGGCGAQEDPVADTLGLAQRTIEHHTQLRLWFGRPAATLYCGNGFYFDGERSWMNRHVFHADSARVCQALQALCPGERFLAPTPGQTVRMVDGSVTEIAPATVFLSCNSRWEWPAREYDPHITLIDAYAPACGRRSFSDSDMAELKTYLDLLAAFVLRQPFFRSFAAVDAAALSDRRPTLALVLLADAQGHSHAFELDAGARAFRPSGASDPPATYVAGLELWANDLLALGRGELAPTAIALGRGRAWRWSPEIRLSLELLCECFHPLNHPALYLSLYRRLLAREPTVVERAPALASGIALAKRL